MHTQSDFLLNLAWLIPLFPFLAFVAIPLGVYHNRKLSHSLAIGGIAIACAISLFCVFPRAVWLWARDGTLAYESPLILGFPPAMNALAWAFTLTRPLRSCCLWCLSSA